MDTPPQAVIIAGPNGAGKTTAAKGLLPVGVGYVNADLIAQRLSGKSDSPGGLEAMRMELAEIERLVAARESFAVETTLAPRAFEKRIAQWKAAGYDVGLIFMSLPNAELAIERVRMRVARGGHDVPEEIIRQCYEEGLRNFFQRYRDVAHRWHLFDNQGNVPMLIAKGSSSERTRIVSLQKWSTLESRYGK